MTAAYQQPQPPQTFVGSFSLWTCALGVVAVTALLFLLFRYLADRGMIAEVEPYFWVCLFLPTEVQLTPAGGAPAPVVTGTQPAGGGG